MVKDTGLRILSLHLPTDLYAWVAKRAEKTAEASGARRPNVMATIREILETARTAEKK